MTSYFNFRPDIIVETTSVCDRKCAGCYAPNVTTQEDSQSLIKTNPALFLNVESLRNMLMQISANKILNPIISLRGGEPTRHPELREILTTVSHTAKSIFLETHGRWILQSDAATQDLFRVCFATQTIIKISFDKMHGLSKDQLKAMTQKLCDSNIKFVIAITESTETDFLNSRSACDWLMDNQIIFQKKALTADDLIQPSVGVIGVDGKLNSALNARPSFSISFRQKTKEVAV